MGTARKAEPLLSPASARLRTTLQPLLWLHGARGPAGSGLPLPIIYVKGLTLLGSDSTYKERATFTLSSRAKTGKIRKGGVRSRVKIP